MIGLLMQMALAPAFICMFYIFIRDKYEKEPVKMLFLGVLYGVYMIFPVIALETQLAFYTPQSSIQMEALYDSFIVASLSEEGIKYVILYFLVWKNKNFNERFDGIVYAVFISLGFAGLENIMYVLHPNLGGFQTAISRAVISVPAHALFGVFMGYYFAVAKYEPAKRRQIFFSAFLVPWILHGIYDYILLSGMYYYFVLLIPFVLYLWVSGFKKMHRHIEQSPFKEKS